MMFIKPLSVGSRNNVWKLRFNGKLMIAKTADILKQKQLVKELKHEAEIYDQLSELQGVVIPRVVYCGTFYCLFIFGTEMCGKSLDLMQKQENMDLNELKTQAERGLEAIHSFSVLHGDIRENNLVWNSKAHRLYWIDFGFSKKNAKQEEMDVEKKQLQDLFECLNK